MNAFLQLEGNILLWIQENLRSDFLDPVFRFLSTIGNAGIFWIALTAILLIFKKTRKTGILCAISMLLTMLAVNITIKPLVGRIRPYEIFEGLKILVATPSDASFPSGHSANSFTCAWVLFGMLPRKWRIYPVVLAALIAFSRLWVGVHYPTDVIAGSLIGIIMACISLRIGKCRAFERI